MDSRSRSRRVGLLAIGLFAVVFGPVATYQLTLSATRSPALLLTDIAVGWSMIGAGLILCDRRFGNRIGPLAIATGFAWFAGDFTSSSIGVVAYVAAVFHGWFDPLFAILILAYPTGRLVHGIDRGLALGFVVVQGAWTVAKAIADRPVAWWANPPTIGSVDAYIGVQAAMGTIGSFETLALSALSLGVLLVVARRWIGASGTARRRLAPVLSAGIVLTLGFVGTFLLQTVVPTSARTPVGEVLVVGLGVLRILVAVGLMIGILRDDSARGRIADLVVTLGGLPSSDVLRDSLRDALRDPSLDVYRWEPAVAGYVDVGGRPVDPPQDGLTRSVLSIANDGVPMLAIAHDPALRDDPGLMSAAVAAVRLAVENERLHAEVLAQLEAVRGSRARLVEAQDTERRKIERDLHDGAQQRLVSLQLSLQMLRRGLGKDIDAATRAELDAATLDAEQAMVEIRELARGVHPGILTEAGLGPALASLVERSPLPVRLETDLDDRLAPPIEATAYFVVAESLTNTAKHGSAGRATVRVWVEGDRLHLDIADDGQGGATLDGGTGLRGLEDRVTALGGTFRVVSPAGGGTRILADLPCASS